jgi:hypothetical protein
MTIELLLREIFVEDFEVVSVEVVVAVKAVKAVWCRSDAC